MAIHHLANDTSSVAFELSEPIPTCLPIKPRRRPCLWPRSNATLLLLAPCCPPPHQDLGTQLGTSLGAGSTGLSPPTHPPDTIAAAWANVGSASAAGSAAQQLDSLLGAFGSPKPGAGPMGLSPLLTELRAQASGASLYSVRVRAWGVGWRGAVVVCAWGLSGLRDLGVVLARSALPPVATGEAT